MTEKFMVFFEATAECYEMSLQIDGDGRWLVALISDTDMRLSEAAGLHINNIMLDNNIPYIDLKLHPWRGLKTKGS